MSDLDLAVENNNLFRSIAARKAIEMLTNGSKIQVLDVRTEEEFNGPLGHIDGALLIPLNELESRLKELEKFREKKILVVCRAGHRSKTACRLLSQNGFNDILEADTGMEGIREAEKGS